MHSPLLLEAYQYKVRNYVSLQTIPYTSWYSPLSPCENSWEYLVLFYEIILGTQGSNSWYYLYYTWSFFTLDWNRNYHYDRRIFSALLRYWMVGEWLIGNSFDTHDLVWCHSENPKIVACKFLIRSSVCSFLRHYYADDYHRQYLSPRSSTIYQ